MVKQRAGGNGNQKQDKRGDFVLLDRYSAVRQAIESETGDRERFQISNCTLETSPKNCNLQLPIFAPPVELTLTACVIDTDVNKKRHHGSGENYRNFSEMKRGSETDDAVSPQCVRHIRLADTQ